MPITDEEYEEVYVEALRCLAENGHVVGEPFPSVGGQRYCVVDGFQLDDKCVLELWWGREITAEILEGRTVSKAR
jgi:hypothetical protein